MKAIFSFPSILNLNEKIPDFSNEIVVLVWHLLKVKLINCVGGGSSAMGFWNEFINYNSKHNLNSSVT